MLNLLRGAVTAVALAMGLSAMLAIALSTGSSAAASDQEIAQALRAGGLVIVLRHGATFPIRRTLTRSISTTSLPSAI